jgi:sulfoxide reductase heme-binding subunit YedZ
MSDTKSVTSKSGSIASAGWWVLGGLTFLGVILTLVIAAQLPAAQSLGQMVSWLFSLDSAQTMWYVTRAAGLTSYVLIWLSVAWGLAVSSKILDRVLNGTFTYDFHEFLSLAAVGFVFLHIGVLLFDSYMPYSLLQLLVPFTSTYRPLWVAVGIIGFYLTLLVTITFYLRSRIGMKAFRAIHYLSLLAYLGVTLHGFMAGTDSSLISVMGLYAGTFLVTVFLTVYMLAMLLQKKQTKRQSAIPAARQTASRF